MKAAIARPMIVPAMTSKEDDYRGKIGLPSLLPGKFDALKQSMYCHLVVEHQKPLHEWETRAEMPHPYQQRD